MADDYSWRELRGGWSFRLPGPERLGGWYGVALIAALVLHIVLYFWLGQIRVGLGLAPAPVVETARMNLNSVEVAPAPFDKAPDEAIEAPPTDPTTLLEEIDQLDLKPKDMEVDIRPEVAAPEIALRMQKPAMAGDEMGVALEPAVGAKVDAKTENFGRSEELLEPASSGRVVVDPGVAKSDMLDPDQFNEQLLRKGVGGSSTHGVMEGFTSLDDMLNLPGNDLVNATAMIGSDLLFDYNSPVLRESAKVSLMKVALLLDKNPEMFCLLDGHTDLFGGDEFNMNLSRKRAEAVRDYLVGTLRFSGERIVVRGHGKNEPLVKTGTVEQQALNRRVEIKMRNQPPSEEAILVKPRRRPSAAELGLAPEPQLEAPRAQPVVPEVPRAQPVEEPAPVPRAAPVVESPVPVGRALPVEDGAARAVPVEEAVGRAVPVEEGAGRAVPVGEEEP